MHSIFQKLFLLAIPAMIPLAGAHAQFTNRFEVGFNAGTLIYQGDLAASAVGYTKSLHPAIGVYLSKPLDNYFSLRLNITRGRIGADESTYDNPLWRRFRNFKFSSPVTELTGMVSWNPLMWIDRYASRKLSPYFFAGAGVAILNVKRDWSAFDPAFFGNKSSAVTGLGIDTLYRTPGAVLIVPVGAGLQYLLSNRVALNAEGTYRLTSSDMIDGFKYAADPKSKDYYYGFSLGLCYHFGNNETDCSRVRF